MRDDVVSVNVKSPGARPLALVFHGLCSSPLEVRQFSRMLAARGFEVLTPTIPGYTAEDGGPARGASRACHLEWIRHAVAHVDRAAARGPVVVSGVSLGATLALAVAHERPRAVEALSLISTTLIFDGWNVSNWRFLLPLALYTPLGRLYRYRESPPYGVKNERVRAWVAAQLAAGRVSSAGAPTIPVHALREADRLVRHVRNRLPGVRTPTLMIHARDDDVAGLSNVRLVRDSTRSSCFQQFIVEDSFHMITIDNDREVAAARTAQFFRRALGNPLVREEPAAFAASQARSN